MLTSRPRFLTVAAALTSVLALAAGAVPGQAATQTTVDPAESGGSSEADVRSFTLNNAPRFVVMTIRVAGPPSENVSTIAEVRDVGSVHGVEFHVDRWANGEDGSFEGFYRYGPRGESEVDCPALRTRFLTGNRLRISFPQRCLGASAGALKARAVTRDFDGGFPLDRGRFITVKRG